MGSDRGDLAIISCASGMHFAEKVDLRLKELFAESNEKGYRGVIKSEEVVFANTEPKTKLLESIRGCDVYVFQDVENKSNGKSDNDNFIALTTAINAAKLSKAHHVSAVTPIFPYSRQHAKRGRESVTAKLAAGFLELSGASNVITLDLHRPEIESFFDIDLCSVDNLQPVKDFKDYIKEKVGLDNLVIASPDAGGVERARNLAKKLGLEVIIGDKRRVYTKANVVEEINIIGDVKGKRAFVFDDMIDTAGSFDKMVRSLRDHGAIEVYYGTSLLLLNGNAVKNITSAYSEGLVTKVIGTNAVYQDRQRLEKLGWYDEIGVEKLFARAIFNINHHYEITKWLE